MNYVQLSFCIFNPWGAMENNELYEIKYFIASTLSRCGFGEIIFSSNDTFDINGLTKVRDEYNRETGKLYIEYGWTMVGMYDERMQKLFNGELISIQQKVHNELHFNCLVDIFYSPIPPIPEDFQPFN